MSQVSRTIFSILKIVTFVSVSKNCPKLSKIVKKFSKLWKIIKIYKNCQKLSKIIKNCQNCQNCKICQKLSKIVKIVKICHKKKIKIVKNCQNENHLAWHACHMGPTISKLHVIHVTGFLGGIFCLVSLCLVSHMHVSHTCHIWLKNKRKFVLRATLSRSSSPPWSYKCCCCTSNKAIVSVKA